MANTFEHLCDLVRSLLGDTDVAGGDVFTNEAITEPYKAAWAEMMAMMTADQIPAAKRIWYETLASYTSRLVPTQAAITDLESVVALEERPAGTSVTISDVVDDGGGAIQITTSGAHALSSNQKVFVGDVSGVPEANGSWFVTVSAPTIIVLRGSSFREDSDYDSGGTIVTSSDQFRDVHRVEDLPDRDPQAELGVYSWREDAFQFIGATADIQLRITFMFNNEAPTTGSLVYSGIKNPLAHRAAAILAYAHNRGQQEAGRLDVEARGPRLDGCGGLYYLFLSQKVREMQKTLMQRPVRPPDHLADLYSNF